MVVCIGGGGHHAIEFGVWFVVDNTKQDGQDLPAGEFRQKKIVGKWCEGAGEWCGEEKVPQKMPRCP